MRKKERWVGIKPGSSESVHATVWICKDHLCLCIQTVFDHQTILRRKQSDRVGGGQVGV